MKKLTATFLLLLPLSACRGTSPASLTLEQHLQNPLFAEAYGDLLSERMTNLIIQNDPLLQESGKTSLVDKANSRAVSLAKEATAKQREGLTGEFIGDKEFTKGEVLLLGDTLYLGPTFETSPGTELHLYLTTVVDPRDVTFPDPSSVDIGPLQSIWSDQWYAVPEDGADFVFRSVVLWDKELERLYGFAQLETP